MKIAYIGNFRPTFSTENHLTKTMESMGHSVLRLQEDNFNAGDLYSALMNWKPDLVLYTRTWGIVGDGMWLMRMLERKHIPTVSYHLDLYVGLKRGEKEILSVDPFWHTKYVFTVDGDPASAEFFKECGINHFYCRAGVFKPECYMAEPDIKYDYDVVFVGSYDYHPEWPYRQKLVDWLHATYGAHFGKFGNPQETIREHELNVLYASAKVVVGDSLTPGFTHKQYWSDRVYETTGRGGFLVHPYVEGMEEEFNDCEHLVYYTFDDFKHLKKIIDFYISEKGQEARKNIQRQGHQQTKEKYTYETRLHQIFATVCQHEPHLMGRL